MADLSLSTRPSRRPAEVGVSEDMEVVDTEVVTEEEVVRALVVAVVAEVVEIVSNVDSQGTGQESALLVEEGAAVATPLVVVAIVTVAAVVIVTVEEVVVAMEAVVPVVVIAVVIDMQDQTVTTVVIGMEEVAAPCGRVEEAVEEEVTGTVAEVLLDTKVATTETGRGLMTARVVEAAEVADRPTTTDTDFTCHDLQRD
jgi:hypothetical protein